MEPPRPGCCDIERAAAPADAACEEADQPDEREHGCDDEEPLDDEPRAERDDRQNRQNYEKKHGRVLL
jgi:hypothetical protein